MKPLFDISKLHTFKGTSNIEFECEICSAHFLKKVTYIRSCLRRKLEIAKYCSIVCRTRSKCTSIIMNCGQCAKTVTRGKSEVMSSKSGQIFCSRSCSITYHNTHKTKGTRKSKLEGWVANQIRDKFPDLEFLENDKTAINSELDFYFPTLKLAVELNGIFHYEPIFSEEKLKSIQNNDQRKFQACLELGIELVIIDTSSQIKFTEKSSAKYLEIICKIIESKIGTA